MFRGTTQTYAERVDIIGNKEFLEFVDQLEREEDIALDTFVIGEPVHIETITPDRAKADRDIPVPVLTPILARKRSLTGEIASLDVSKLNSPVLPKSKKDEAAKRFRYEGYDIITLEKLVEREYSIPPPATAEEVVSSG